MKTRAGKPRDPAKEQFWRRTVTDQTRSNLSIRAYCQRQGLDHRNFNWWRRELARRDAVITSDRTAEREISSTEPLHSTFLPVRVVQDAPDATVGTAPIEIVFPAGPTVRVTHGFDPHALDAVLSVLEARTC